MENKTPKPRGYWLVKENVISASKECKNLVEFMKKYHKAYKRALYGNYLDELYWLYSETNGVRKKQTKWTYEMCYEIAKKYEYLKDFSANEPRALDAARNNSWIESFDWLKKTCRKLTDEEILNEVRKYKSITELRKKDESLFMMANRRNGLLEESGLTIERKPYGYYTYEVCYDLASKYKMSSKFMRKHPTAYNTARKNGWLIDYVWFNDKDYSSYGPIDSVYVYIFEKEHTIYIGRCLMDIKENRHYSHRTDRKDAVCRFCTKNNIETPPMKTIEENMIINDALELENKLIDDYRKAGWNVLNKQPSGVRCGSVGFLGRRWTRIACIRERNKYDTWKEFREQSPGAYHAMVSKYRDLLPTKRINNKVKVLKADLNDNIIEIYCSIAEAARLNNVSYKKMSNWIDCGKQKNNKANGYYFIREDDFNKNKERKTNVFF